MRGPVTDPLRVEEHPVEDLRSWRAEVAEQTRLLLRHTLYLGLDPVYSGNRRTAMRIFHARVDYISRLLAQGLELAERGELR